MKSRAVFYIEQDIATGRFWSGGQWVKDWLRAFRSPSRPNKKPGIRVRTLSWKLDPIKGVRRARPE